MKIVGVLLIIAFLIMPAAAARPLSSTPERMVAVAAVIGALGAVAGLLLSYLADLPAGPAIVLVLTAMCALTLAPEALRAR
jgi:zinc transport system permease protein